MSKMPKALHFGAGNIGRGFIGYLLNKSGYEVTFVDISKEIVDNINKYQRYNVIILKDPVEKEEVRGVKALHLEEEDKVLDAFLEADVVTTSVGVSNLSSIGERLKKYLKARKEKSEKYLNIMACENALFATDVLKESVVKGESDDFISYLNLKVGFPNTAVDRIVPAVKVDKELPVDVAVEEFFEWDIEKNNVKGNLKIEGAELVDDLKPYIERKLFLLNGAHATTAYLGYLKGYTYIHQAIKEESIRAVVKGMQEEISTALSKKYDVDKESLMAYAEKVIKRFENPYLQDEVTRVGREPLRKLSSEDRLIAPLKLCSEVGITPNFILYGIAAGLLFDYKEDTQAVKVREYVEQFGIKKAVSVITGLEEESDLVEEIEKRYFELKGKLI
ncbi:D-mannitol 1-phosphate 5-dehydrogenase [Caldanaerobacter subterraneus]|uniref:Mannitol-1-phosphate 5-dehydrogenase n=2 Tax=Caldanaerobacter subterraneus TaxID=911092 RepID=A0A4R2K3L1_9THEO|nr:mannitol-1-phosphate 5-dehydrogenase [Caldanaerobacter subterraneus]TCO66357.1 D-mannitol 1-phosphate 5-dehydrogenase [Caldanaerobacter subterraneus]